MKQRYEVRAWVDDYGVFDTYTEKFILHPESKTLVNKWCIDMNESNKSDEEAMLNDFAGRAMNGIISHLGFQYSGEHEKNLAKKAYDVAEAMLEERKKHLK